MIEYLQSEASECGLACIAYIAGQFGSAASLRSLRSRYPSSTRGATLHDLKAIASHLELTTRAVRCELEQIGDLECPAILHWRMNHFVVLKKVRRGRLYLFDPASGEKVVKLSDADKQFTGIAVEVRKSPNFIRSKKREQIKLSRLVVLSSDSKKSIIHVICFSMATLAYSAISPLFIKFIVDEVIPQSDGDLLIAITIGSLMVGIFGVFAGYFQGVASARLSASLSWDMTARLFRHMVRLPMDWFVKRRAADVISRFDAIEAIRNTVATLVSSILTDVLTIVVTGIMLFVLSPVALVALAGLVLVNIIIKAFSLPLVLKRSGEALSAGIGEHVVRMETVRAIQTIKAMSGELQQEEFWSGKLHTSIAADNRRDRFLMSVRSLEQGTDVVAEILIVYFLASMAISGSLAVGTVFAILAYKGQFSAAADSLIDQIIRWKTGEVYSHRLADVVLTQPETGLARVGDADDAIQGAIRVTGASFRYAPSLPPAFEGVSFEILQGEYVAIVGPSGCGKSTLLAVLCGLYELTEGVVNIDGRPMHHWGHANARAAFGVVLQNDSLLTGTICENVAFFAENIDFEKVWDCLDKAAIKVEVEKMPMGLNTFVGDMGGSLSGGQRQRILVARALYKDPKVLLFDEATSHLDSENERIMNKNIADLNVTRIVVAHRAETIKSADKIYHMGIHRFISHDEIDILA